MKIEKPLTEKMREKANACYRLFRDTDGYLTKSEIGEYLSLKDERQVRDVISLVATKVPIISKSNSKGYKMAKTAADYDEAMNTWAEVSSRMEQLEKRIYPLIKFKDKIKGEQK